MLQRTIRKLKENLPVKIVAYGDSISEIDRTPGYFGGASSLANNWAQQLGRLLAAAYPGKQFIVEHFAIGGQNSYEGLGRQDWLGPYAPDLVLIEFGANDSANTVIPPEATERAMDGLIAAAVQRFKADVVVLGLAGQNPAQPHPAWQHEEETRAAIVRAAERAGVPCVNLRAAVLAATGDGQKWAAHHNGAQDCHPNDAGHAVWAQAEFETLRREIGAPHSL
jgi:lysophospholipase L1-like esterase